MKIADLMTANPDFVTPDDNLLDVAQLMAQKDVGLIPVCESRDTQRVIGVITDRDLVVRVIADGRDVGSTPIEDVMTQRLVTVNETDDLPAVQAEMEKNQVRRVLVIDEYGALTGVISTADLARALEEREVGEVLEAISEPPGVAESPSPQPKARQ